MKLLLRTCARLAVGVLFWYGFSAAFGQSRLDSIQQLDEVVVTAKSYKEVIPSQKLSGKELKNLNSFSVADAIRYFSGVQLKDYGGVGGIKTVNIRTMGTNHMGVFYDGVQLSNAQNGQVDLGMYSLDNIEVISLYNGQKSEIFQSAKDFNVAGSIYLRTRIPRFEGGKNFNIRASLKMGSFNLVNPSVLLENKLSEKVKSSFSAEWLSSSGKYKFRYRRKVPVGDEILYDTTAVRQNGDIRATRMEGALYGMVKDGNWFLKAYNYTSERGVPGAIVNNVWRRGERIWDNNSFLQGSYRREIGEKFKTQFLAKYSYFLTKYVNKDTTVKMIDNVYKQKEMYLSSANVYNVMRNWDVSLAYDFQWNNMEAEMTGFVWPTRFTHLLSVATAFQVGKLKVQGSAVMTHIKDKLLKADSPGNKTVFTPAVFLSVAPFRKNEFSIRAFVKKSFRMPTFNDLYYADMGNSQLRPEYTTQYDLGLFYEKRFANAFFKEFRLQADGYYNLVKDKIIAYPKGAQFRWTMLNLGKVDIRGVDVSAEVGVEPFRNWLLTAKVQYTYQRAIDITDPSDTYYRDQIPYIPWHSGSVIAHLQYKSWGLNYSFIYVGERYNQQENIIYNHTQPWYTSDVTLAKDFSIRKYKCKASLEVNNLFSQDYDVILNYPMPKRNFRVTLILEI